MLSRLILTLVVLCIAIGGGAASAWYVLDIRHGLGALVVGPWIAFPDMGTAHADPYARARTARQGLLVAGAAEGLAFVAGNDQDGEALRRECRYTLAGPSPAARFWTLYATDDDGRPLDPPGSAVKALRSQDALRRADGSIVVTVGRGAAPGNWLRIGGSGGMRLVLTLYDTPATSSASDVDLALPGIRRERCDA